LAKACANCSGTASCMAMYEKLDSERRALWFECNSEKLGLGESCAGSLKCASQARLAETRGPPVVVSESIVRESRCLSETSLEQVGTDCVDGGGDGQKAEKPCAIYQDKDFCENGTACVRSADANFRCLPTCKVDSDCSPRPWKGYRVQGGTCSIVHEAMRQICHNGQCALDLFGDGSPCLMRGGTNTRNWRCDVGFTCALWNKQIPDGFESGHRCQVLPSGNDEPCLPVWLGKWYPDKPPAVKSYTMFKSEIAKMCRLNSTVLGLQMLQRMKGPDNTCFFRKDQPCVLNDTEYLCQLGTTCRDTPQGPRCTSNKMTPDKITPGTEEGDAPREGQDANAGEAKEKGRRPKQEDGLARSSCSASANLAPWLLLLASVASVLAGRPPATSPFPLVAD